MGTLIRFWVLPGRLRRLPRWARWALVVAAVAILAPLPAERCWQLRQFFIHYSWGWTLYGLWGIAQVLLGPFVSAVALLGGAISIARDRQRRIWQPLATTALRPTGMVLARAVATMINTALLVAPAVAAVFLGFELRYGAWGLAELLLVGTILLRIVSFSLIGMAISVRCRRVGTALGIAGAGLAGYAALLFANPSYFWYGYSVNYDPHLHAHLFFWPMLIAGADYGGTEWRLGVIADIVWGVCVPAICFVATRWSLPRLLDA